jgi:dTDP-4-dehydrorhamnose reductase
MKTIVVGGLGQLGRALMAALAAAGHDAVVWDVPEVDITRPEISGRVAEAKPDVLINAAAWTNVDGAEANPAAAYAVNALGPRHLAEGCAAAGALMLQVSTNEVFPGLVGRFYFEDDLPQPGGAYARSKVAGERAAAAAHRGLLIVRIAWLFGPGGVNFPTKIVGAADKMAAENKPLRVVDDEFGNPTSAPDTAAAMVRLLEAGRPGAYHLVNEGFCSRYAMAQAVLQAAGRGHVAIEPTKLADYPRPSPPPPHAVLVNQAAAALGITLRPWQEAVAEYAASLAAPATQPAGPAAPHSPSAPGQQNSR